jgi:Gas vesicle synthesis protein GvpO
MADRKEAQRGRAEARQRRRKQAGNGAKDSEEKSAEKSANPTREHAIDEVKSAAKVAAASAAVGAAIAGARALTARDGDAEESTAEDPQPPDESHAEELEQSAPADEDQTREAPEPEQSAETKEPAAEETAAASTGRDAGSAGGEKPLVGASAGTAKATVERAREQLESLLGRTPESVSALEHFRDGWLVTLEVVEVSRIPDSTDVLASYEMELDEDGNLRRYARVRRYRRSQADDGDRS